MAANSKNYYDVLQWIYKVLYSCETFDQVRTTQKLTRAFKKQFPYKEVWDNIYMDQTVLDEICLNHMKEKISHEKSE